MTALFEVKQTSYGIECHIAEKHGDEEHWRWLSVRKTYRQALEDCGQALDEMQTRKTSARRALQRMVRK